MLRYLVTSEKLKGALKFGFDREGGHLVYFEQMAELNESQLALFSWSFPYTHQYFLEFVAAHPSLVVEEISETPFDAFWRAYGNKVGKKDAEKAWSKMPEVKRRAALAYVPRYKQRKAKEGTAMHYPATYLRAEPWEDEK